MKAGKVHYTSDSLVIARSDLAISHQLFKFP